MDLSNPIVFLFVVIGVGFQLFLFLVGIIAFLFKRD